MVLKSAYGGWEAEMFYFIYFVNLFDFSEWSGNF